MKKVYQFLIVVLVLPVVGLLVWMSIEQYKRGEIGDMFGGVEALFSGLAFGGIILALIFQKKELSLQRLELALTREELSKSSIAQEKSQKALNEQLRNMQLASKFDIVSKYLDGLQGQSKFGEEYAARQIVFDISENILQLEEYSHFLHPRFIIENHQPFKPSGNIPQEYKYKINFNNAGAPGEVTLTDTSIKTRLLEGSIVNISEGKILSVLLSKKISDSHEFNLTLRSRIIRIKKTWIQKVTINLINSRYQISINKPELR